MVVQIVGNYVMLFHPNTPLWACNEYDRRKARAWLREQYLSEERRYDVTQAMEMAILVLVGFAAIGTAVHFITGR